MMVWEEDTADFNSIGSVCYRKSHSLVVARKTGKKKDTLVVKCSNRESSSEYKSAVSNLVNTCLIPLGTSIKTPSGFISAFILPATFTSDLLKKERNSGVSKAERRTDCRRLIDLRF
jgi:hypothetical protein